jgi:hypothetical protein
MSVSPKRKDVLLHFLHTFETNLASDFLTRTRNITYTSATGKTQTPTLFLKNTREIGARVSPVFDPVHQVVKVLIGRHPRSVFKQVEIVVLLYKRDV